VVAVRLGRAIEDHWLILEGVKPGDRVIVDGFQKFVAGDVVRPKAWQRSDPQTQNATGANDSTSEH
jgi:membrane fusion protein (multidrug efflux system)